MIIHHTAVTLLLSPNVQGGPESLAIDLPQSCVLVSRLRTHQQPVLSSSNLEPVDSTGGPQRENPINMVHRLFASQLPPLHNTTASERDTKTRPCGKLMPDISRLPCTLGLEWKGRLSVDKVDETQGVVLWWVCKFGKSQFETRALAKVHQNTYLASSGKGRFRPSSPRLASPF